MIRLVFLLLVICSQLDQTGKLSLKKAQAEEKDPPPSLNLIVSFEYTPKGIRIPVASVKGRCPRPLDDGGLFTRPFLTLSQIFSCVNN